MKSTRSVTKLSRGRGPSVHRYYDIPVESPDGSRILYFEFDGPVPGPGTVIVADADGSDPREVGRCEGDAIGHVGAQQLWIDDQTVCFLPQGQDVSLFRIVSLCDGGSQDIKGQVRSYHPQTGQAGIFRDPRGSFPADDFRSKQRPELGVWRPDYGSYRQVLTLEQARDVHPRREEVDLSQMNMMNCKWSPGGESMFVVFTDEIFARQPGRERTIKSLIRVSADGSDVRYLGEFTHHPMWAPDGESVIAHLAADYGQDLMRYPLDGGEPEAIIRDFRGIHSSLNRAQTHVLTDVHGWPEAGGASVLLWTIGNSSAENLATGEHDRTGHSGGTHVHPQWSRDETRVLFNHRDTGQAQLYAIDMT